MFREFQFEKYRQLVKMLRVAMTRDHSVSQHRRSACYLQRINFALKFMISVKRNAITLRSLGLLSLNRVTVKWSMRTVIQSVLGYEFPIILMYNCRSIVRANALN